MNIGKNKLSKTSLQKHNNIEKPKSLDKIKKDAMLSLYKKTRTLDDSQKEFNSIEENFSNPKTGERYSLSVSYAYNSKIPEQKTLNVSYSDNIDEYQASITVLRGLKQDILDFLGDERNVSVINQNINYLRQKMNSN